MKAMYPASGKFQARIDAKNCVSTRAKKEPGKLLPGVRSNKLEMFYGVFVLGGVAGAFVVAGAGDGVFSDWLQPVNTALKAMPNSTTMDSFFIGSGNVYFPAGKHK